MTRAAGEIIAQKIIIEAGTRQFSNTSPAQLPGWALPNIVYEGGIIDFEVEIPLYLPSVAATVTFQLFTGLTKLASKGKAYTTAGGDHSLKASVPIVGSYDLEPGDVIQAPTVWASTTAGTVTVQSYWNNALFGSCPVILKAIQR